jgi:hypothetical protein
MDTKILKLLVEFVSRLADTIVGIVNDDLASLLLEEVESLLFETKFNALPKCLRLGRLFS